MMIEFQLDETSGVATYLQLAQQVHRALRMGTLEPGDQLPTAQQVVAQLAINPNTVHKAYRELERAGLVRARPGLGTFVTRVPAGPDPAIQARFLATVRHHLRDEGIAVFQLNPPDWFERFEDADPVRDDPGGIRRIIRAARWEPPCMRVEVEYQVAGNVWTHSWASYQISDEELASDLAGADLRFGGWLTGDHAWFTARPALPAALAS